MPVVMKHSSNTSFNSKPSGYTHVFKIKAFIINIHYISLILHEPDHCHSCRHGLPSSLPNTPRLSLPVRLTELDCPCEKPHSIPVHTGCEDAGTVTPMSLKINKELNSEPDELSGCTFYTNFILNVLK